MAAFSKFNVFTTDLCNGSHNFAASGGHTFKIMLTNSSVVATNSIKGDLTDLSTANGYTAGGNSTTITKSNSSGTEKITGSDPTTWTASGSVGPFRYAVLYNDTQTTPVKPLVGYWDYGSSITLASGETFTVDLDGTNGIFTIA